MVFFNDENLTAEEFLRDYWQQQPLLLRQALPAFRPPLDADDIAGLACDELAESRLVTGNHEKHNWTLRYGPFDEKDFSALPACDWTLLVQDVDKHYPPSAELFDSFDFLPRWRIDDLMVSVAAPGDSVGPHVDQYDVFLLQAAGRRRWETARCFEPERLDTCDLRVLRHFSAEQQWILEPGDMLYLPPGVAHHGVALEGRELCMTWSVGMRSPSAADLLQALGEWLAEAQDEGARYRDQALSPGPRAGEIDANAVRGMRDLLRTTLDDAALFPRFIGTFLSRYRLAHEPAPPPDPVDAGTLLQMLRAGAGLRHNPWTRLLWLESSGAVLLFAAGDCYPCARNLASVICDPGLLEQATAAQLEKDTDLLCTLVNRGHLVIERL